MFGLMGIEEKHKELVLIMAENIWLTKMKTIKRHEGKVQSLKRLQPTRADRLYFAGLSAGYSLVAEYVIDNHENAPFYLSLQWQDDRGYLAYCTFKICHLSMKLIGISRTSWLLERFEVIELDPRIGLHDPYELNQEMPCHAQAMDGLLR